MLTTIQGGSYVRVVTFQAGSDVGGVLPVFHASGRSLILPGLAGVFGSPVAAVGGEGQLQRRCLLWLLLLQPADHPDATATRRDQSRSGPRIGPAAWVSRKTGSGSALPPATFQTL